MNRSLYIIMVPVLLVALGYIVVFRSMGLAPGYPRLIIAVTLFFGAIWWLGRKTARKAGSSR
jgi:ABC-type spermidine/putrescine transport system permease subunit II